MLTRQQRNELDRKIAQLLNDYAPATLLRSYARCMGTTAQQMRKTGDIEGAEAWEYVADELDDLSDALPAEEILEEWFAVEPPLYVPECYSMRGEA